MNNVRVLYGNQVYRELLEVEVTDESYKFRMHALMTNPNYTSKRMVFLLFINNRLVESSCKFANVKTNDSSRRNVYRHLILAIRKMLEELYTFYLPKRTHPWCYISLEIHPQNVDVNVHPTKYEVKFLHESSIIERIKSALDEKLSGNSASRTFYVQARLPKADVTKEVLKEVLPEYEKGKTDKTKVIRPQEMIRTDASDQKLDKFNFTIHSAMKHSRNSDNITSDVHVNENADCGKKHDVNISDEQGANEMQWLTPDINSAHQETYLSTPWSEIINDSSPPTSSEIIIRDTSNLSLPAGSNKDGNESKLNSMQDMLDITDNEFDESMTDDSTKEKCIDIIAEKVRKQVYQRFRTAAKEETVAVNTSKNGAKPDKTDKHNELTEVETVNVHASTSANSNGSNDVKSVQEFKSYSVNNFRREVKLTSVLKLRKEVENECHEGLREILSNLTFVGCIDQSSALIQSGVNLYLCDTKKLA